MSQESSVFAQLGRHSLLNVVPGLEQLIAEKGQVRVVEKNREVVKQGKPIKYLIIPLSHGLQLMHSKGQTRTSIGMLRRGRTLALRQILFGEVYPYSADTETSTSMLILPVEDFLTLVASKPLVLRYLRLVASAKSVRRFKSFMTDKAVPNEAIVELIGMIPEQQIKVPEGQELKTDNLCFVENGKLRIDANNTGRGATTYVGEGDFFGGEALVSPFAWGYKARAVSETNVRMVRVGDIKDKLVRLGIVDSLYEEPCLWARGDESTRMFKLAKVSTLPGTVVDPPTLRFDARDLQSSVADGESFAASACNVLSFVGLGSSPANLETELTMAGRATWLRVAELLEPLGAVCHAVQRKRLTRLNLPALTMLLDRLVVILEIEKASVLLHDPARGFVRVAMVDWPASWNGQLLEVGRADHGVRATAAVTAEEEDEPSPRKVVLDLGLRIVGENRGLLLTVLGLSLLGVGLATIAPFFTQLILDDVLSLRDMGVLWGCAAGIFLATILSAVSRYFQSRLFNDFSVDFERKISVALYRRGLSLPLSAFRQHKAGDMLSRLGELGVIESFLSVSSIQAVLSIFTVIVSAAVLTAFSGKAAALAAVIASVTMVLQYAFRRALRRLYTRTFNVDRECTSLLAEQIDAIGTVKASAAETAMMRRWETAYVHGLDLSYRAGLLQIFSSGLVSTLAKLARLGGVWLAAQEALAGGLSNGQVFAVSLYLNQLIGGLLSVGGFLSQIQRLMVALDRVGEVMANPEVRHQQNGPTTMSVQLKGKIRFDHVSFRYGTEGDLVLRDLSFSIYPQQVVAIVGRSGCGKTTIAHLLAGQLKPTSGRIFLDNYDSAFLSPSMLSQQIGFVMQTNQLFQASIGENLTYTDDAPKLDRRNEVAAQAAAADFITADPSGFNRYLGEGGLGVSGGQKQRLSLARTLYRNPRIMIMDEATSALDAVSERQIVGNMREILQGRTSIVIAHRLSTIRHADLILVMRDGHIVEQGTHQELFKAGGHYFELFESQMQGRAA